MSLISVDVEADGPCPGIYSMISFGAVLVGDTSKTFYAELPPITDDFVEGALAVSGHTRDSHSRIETDPATKMREFADWISSVSTGKPVFISDNPAFDWQFINYYFHLYLKSNPFGHSARRIGDIYSGLCGDLRAGSDWKRYRRTKHTHNPVDDAKGNAEAIQAIINQIRGLK